jgi:hypothetical protein
VAAGLTGNAVTNVLPAGDAAGATVQFRMLATEFVDADNAAGGMTAASLLGIKGLLALPIFTLPAILRGAPVSAGLAHRSAGSGRVRPVLGRRHLQPRAVTGPTQATVRHYGHERSVPRSRGMARLGPGGTPLAVGRLEDGRGPDHRPAARPDRAVSSAHLQEGADRRLPSTRRTSLPKARRPGRRRRSARAAPSTRLPTDSP